MTEMNEIIYTDYNCEGSDYVGSELGTDSFYGSEYGLGDPTEYILVESPLSSSTNGSAPMVKTGTKRQADTKMNASIPGKAPRKADSELTPEELARRNRRRMRNREAATRQRDRRLGKVAGLENEIKELREQGNGLKSENEKLKEEIEQLRFQLQMNSSAIQVKTQPPVSPFFIQQQPPMTPTILQIQTPLFQTATDLANQNQFQFPPQLQRLNSHSSMSEFSEFVAVL
jgi:hypothetical protein